MKTIDKTVLIDAIKKSNKIRDLTILLKCSIPRLRENIKLYGMKYPDYRHRAYCDNEFFGRKDEKAMYWAGFLAADGCIRDRKYTYSIKLELATADRKHIERFKQDTKSEAIIYDVVRAPSKLIINGGGTKDKYYSSYFVINSKQMFNDLATYNIVPKKTYIYEMPEWLIKHQFVRHFIRGYIDGDGSFGFNKRNNNISSIRLQLTGASNVVEQIYNILKFNCHTKYGGYKKYNNKKKTFWFNSIPDLNKIINYLYSDTTIYLKRKYDKAQEIQNLLEKSKLYNFDPEELQKLYDKLGSFGAVAQIYKCHRSTIRFAMHNLGLNYKLNPKMNRK
jgi:hypothetical protein